MTTSYSHVKMAPNQLQSHNPPPTHSQHAQHLMCAQLQHQAQAAQAKHVVEQAILEVEWQANL